MPEPTPPRPPPAQPPLRLRRATRDRVTPVPAHRDALLPDDHLARRLWPAVAPLDLRAFATGLKVRWIALWGAVAHNLKLLVTRPPQPTPALAGVA